MNNNVWEDFMRYLRYLIRSGELNADIPELYKPIVIAHFFNAEVYGSGIQSFFEVYSFLLDDVLQAFKALKVSPELIQLIQEACAHKYISDEEIYIQASGDEDKFNEQMEERDIFWDKLNKRYCNMDSNNIPEKILSYIKANNLTFDKN